MHDRLLLTGGTGFFGRALLRHWVTQSAQGGVLPQVTVLTRAPKQFQNRYREFRDQPWLTLHAGDILEPQSLPQGRSFTHVLHAAADSTLGSRLGHLQRYDQIVQGTRNLLEFSVRNGVTRFLLTSSGGVYGPQPAAMERIPEDYPGMPDPLNPANTYGVAKRVAEHLCALYQEARGLDVVIARCFAFVGQDLPLDAHFAIGNFIRDALWAEEVTVAGDGTPLRSYLDQRDLAAWLLALLANGRAGRAYNVGSDVAISIADLAHLVRDLLAPGKPVQVLGRAETTTGRNRYIPDIGRARSELGLEVSIPLGDSILETAAANSAARPGH